MKSRPWPNGYGLKAGAGICRFSAPASFAVIAFSCVRPKLISSSTSGKNNLVIGVLEQGYPTGRKRALRSLTTFHPR